MTKQEFLTGLAMLGARGFQDKAIEKEALTVWFDDLKHLSGEQYEKAITSLGRAKTSWFPSDNIPALILEQVSFQPKKPKVPKLIQDIGEWRAKQKLLNGGE